MFKITSKFYVIYGDDKPIYVGYTNRTVKQRFKEHSKDKDFSAYNKVEVKELKEERLSFDFTWNYGTICKYADIVSDKEAELVNKYNTQESQYQLAEGGGQTWASEKGFVKSNRNNPKFVDMPSSELKQQLLQQKRIELDLYSFISNISSREKIDLGSFINSINSRERIDLHNFINDIKSQEQIDLHNFISNINSREKVDLHSFISNINSREKIDLKHLISNINSREKIDLGNFISNINSRERIDLRNIISHINSREKIDLHNFISNINWKGRVQ